MLLTSPTEPKCTAGGTVHTKTNDDPLLALFDLLEAKQAAEEQHVAELAAEIGHNGGPSLEQLPDIEAKWLSYTEEDELKRLAILNLRMVRKKASLAVIASERQTIMNRCIKRMRRANGKN